ncbi:uncharacterized protein LOC124455367 [Xenia sp. Carnegie-2017]|uniref:uncharacterized protein LOC124455367 n=1 Tax=Xenia sp. Carnegie-2017 TaxID=2897299 RepID=UPI001F0333EA|nr:uncharacterized protein LOC124455367 [Xenia sp. Carnegie-2017]
MYLGKYEQKPKNLQKIKREGLAHEPGTNSKDDFICGQCRKRSTIFTPSSLMSKISFWKNSKEKRLGSNQVSRLDPVGVLACNHAPCGSNAMMTLLKEEGANMCPTRTSQKLMKSLTIKKIAEEITVMYRRSSQVSFEDLVEMLKKVDKNDDLLKCPYVVCKYEDEGFLEPIFPDLDGNNTDVLEKAKEKLKSSKNTAAILRCVTEKTSHCLNLIKDERTGEVHISDGTYGTNEIQGFENVLSLHLFVLSRKGEKIVIAEEWSNCKMDKCEAEYKSGHANNIKELKRA